MKSLYTMSLLLLMELDMLKGKENYFYFLQHVIMCRSSTSAILKVFVASVCLSCLLLIQEINGTEIEKDSHRSTGTDVEGRTQGGTLTLSGSNGNTYLYSALLILPVLLAIILIDFAIFGVFAQPARSWELNPISDFFFHVRRGLQIKQKKYRRRHGLDSYYSHYKRQGPGRKQRYSRFESMFLE